MTYAFSSLDELGDGPGFRKIRKPLGITAFGVNGVVYPPGFPGISHYHDEQDELYFVHSGRALVEVEGVTRELGPGGVPASVQVLAAGVILGALVAAGLARKPS